MKQTCKNCSSEFEAPYHQKTVCDDCIFQNCISCGTQFRTTTQQRRNPKWGKFCSKKCAARFEKPMRFKKSGYWCIKAEDHPKAYERGYYYEHILILEEKLGRYLKKGECVHHTDGDKLNNTPENLELHTRHSHSSYHWPEVSTSKDVGIDYTKYIQKRSPNPVRMVNGYRHLYEPKNPMSDTIGYIPEHRKVMSEHLGRELRIGEAVEHINGVRNDNRLENLKLISRSWAGHGSRFTKERTNKGYRVDDGYVEIWNPDHPMAFSDGYILAHRLIMSEHLGRRLLTDEHVHHINGNRQDNRIENLELLHRKSHPSKHFRR